MKSIKFSNLLIIAFAFVLILSACTKKATKEQAVDFFVKMSEWAQSEDYKNAMKSAIKDQDWSAPEKALKETEDKFAKATNAAYSRKANEISQSLGFKNADELKATEAIMQSNEVKEALKKYEEAIKLTQEQLTKDIVEKIKESANTNSHAEKAPEAAEQHTNEHK